MKRLKLSVIPLLLLLAACGTLGVPPADTFNKQAAAATTTVNTVSQTTLTLLQARKISPEESDRYIDRAETLQQGIDMTRALKATDPLAAQDRLDAIIRSLQLLTAELEARK